MKSRLSKFTTGIVAAMLLGGGLVATATPASATNCNDYRSSQSSGLGYNEYRARATCSQIDGNRKVRAALIRSGGPDYYSQYFTRLNVSYYTGWYSCYAGCNSGYQVANV